MKYLATDFLTARWNR